MSNTIPFTDDGQNIPPVNPQSLGNVPPVLPTPPVSPAGQSSGLTYQPSSPLSGEGGVFVEAPGQAPEIAPILPENLKKPETNINPVSPNNFPKDTTKTIIPDVVVKTPTPEKIVNKTTNKEKLHSVGKQADSITTLADKEEEEFIQGVEKTHLKP